MQLTVCNLRILHCLRPWCFVLSGVRMAAAESLPYLLECARIRGPEYLSNMWQFICPELLKAVDAEPELDVKAEHLYAVSQVKINYDSSCYKILIRT